MREIYAIVLFILLIIMYVTVQRAKYKDNNAAKTVIKLAYIVAFNVIANQLAVFIPDERMAVFFQCLHNASTEWGLIVLLMFLEEYSGRIESTKITRFITCLMAGVISVQLLLTDFVQGKMVVGYRDKDNVAYRYFVSNSIWFNIHTYFSYIIALFGFVVLVFAMFRTVNLYRNKYRPAILSFVLIIALEYVCSKYDTLLDYALVGYISLILFLIYYSLYFIHKDLITKTLSYVMSDSDGGIVCFDIDGNCIYVNEMVNKLYKDVEKLTEYETIFAEYEFGPNMEEKRWNREYDLDGENRFFEIFSKKFVSEKGDYLGCYFLLYDRTEDMKLFTDATYKASHDNLTGFYNKNGFEEAVIKLAEDYPYEPLYLIASDIRDFKLINDLYGFDVGNKIIKEFATAMQETFPDYVACCRIYSDQFAFCMLEKDMVEEKVLEVIDRVKETVEEGLQNLTIHFGIYEMLRGETDVSLMYDHARMAMSSIKNSYQSIFAYYDNRMMRRVRREKELVAEFDNALEEEQFLMYLQPQIKAGGGLVGAEALVRWKHPVYGMVPPGEFIPVLEKSGLIYKLDRYMWEHAAKKLKEWKDSGKSKYHISVNISTKDFLHLDIYRVFVNLVTKYDIDPAVLKLEITESALMNDPERQFALVAKLQEYGFHVEIDDFGSGYSSLNMLKNLKADVLKIDMGFLRSTGEPEREKAILDTIISLAKQLKMEVITEGVELEEQMIYLANAGCDIFQGFYFDRPIPVEEFEYKYF